MINVTVIGGIDSKTLRKAVEDAALKRARIKLRGIRCPDHDRIPRPVVKAGEVEIGSLCCEGLREKVNRAFQKGR